MVIYLRIFRLVRPQRARILKKTNLAWTLEKFKLSLEIFDLAWNFQSRLKFSILTLRIPHKNRGLVGGSLEMFNLAWKCHSFQSRLKISIPEGDLEIFQDSGPLGLGELSIFTFSDLTSIGLPQGVALGIGLLICFSLEATRTTTRTFENSCWESPGTIPRTIFGPNNVVRMSIASDYAFRSAQNRTHSERHERLKTAPLSKPTNRVSNKKTLGIGRGTVGKCTGPKWSKMVQTSILVKKTLFRTGL